MSLLKKKDLHTPFTTKTILKIMGKMQRAVSEQAVAATAAGGVMIGGGPATHAGKILSAFVVLSAAPASGETMEYDLQVNGSSVLTATLTVNDTYSAGEQIELPLDPALLDIAIGDIVTVDRTYTAGGGPTPIANNAVHVEWAA